MKTKITQRLALDRAPISVRSKDADGRLHVETTPISKSNVCGYLGREIPGSEALGLDANKIYQLYRDPDELSKSAASFNGLPVLNQHVPVSAANPQKDAVVGAMGRDAAFTYPYLTNSMTIWDQEAIDAIESGEQKELSSAYRYRPDFTSGVTQDGEKYDAIMRDIVANHLSLVPKGRAGSDVVVGDSALVTTIITTTEKRPMAKKAILSPGAMKAKTTLAQNLKSRLAQDADLSDVIDLLETLEVDPSTVVVEPEDLATDDDVAAQVKSICGEKLSDEDLAKLVALLTPATVAADEGEADKPTDTVVDTFSSVTATVQTVETPLVVVPVIETTVTQPAMDAAIAAAVRAAETNTINRLRAAREAERAVEPYVGKLVAMDSADEVYTAALTQLGIDVSGVHPSAFKAILKCQPLPGSFAPLLASDAATATANDFSSRFPTASKIRHI